MMLPMPAPEAQLAPPVVCRQSRSPTASAAAVTGRDWLMAPPLALKLPELIGDPAAQAWLGVARFTVTVAAAPTTVSRVPTIAFTVIGWLIAAMFAPFGFCPAIQPIESGIWCSLTNAVVASWVEFEACGAVGAVGVPVKPGEPSGARAAGAVPLSWIEVPAVPLRSRYRR